MKTGHRLPRRRDDILSLQYFPLPVLQSGILGCAIGFEVKKISKTGDGYECDARPEKVRMLGKDLDSNELESAGMPLAMLGDKLLVRHASLVFLTCSLLYLVLVLRLLCLLLGSGK